MCPFETDAGKDETTEPEACTSEAMLDGIRGMAQTFAGMASPPRLSVSVDMVLPDAVVDHIAERVLELMAERMRRCP